MQAKHWPAAAALLLLLAALTLLAPTRGAAYEVRQGHPRLFFDKAGLAQIAQRCDKGGPCEASYERLKGWLALTAMKPGTGYYPGEGNITLNLGLVYLVEKQLGRDAAPYLEHIRDRIWKDRPKEFDHNFGWNGILYDWLYEDLTPEERLRYGTALGKMLRHYTDRPEITLLHGTYWYNQTWGGGPTTSWSRDGIVSKTMIALAILGEGTPSEADARQWLDSFARKMPEEFLPKFDLLGGIWPEGPLHGGVTFEPFLSWEAWRFAAGVDLFPRVAPIGFHREAPLWGTYGSPPHTGMYPHMDDCGPASFSFGPGVPYRALHAARYRDGVTQAETLSALNSTFADWSDMVWYDPAIPAMDRAKLPPAYHFKGSGHVFLRSGWEGPDDTWAMISAGPYFTAYGTWGENGTFQITRDGILAGSGGYRAYTSMAPINQNILLVYDPNEKFFNHEGQPLRNDGGSQLPLTYHVLEPMERSKILAYEHSDAYTYVGADLTKAYANTGSDAATKEKLQSEKIKHYTRQFLYVRGNPDFFVIYDRVEAANPAFPKTWLLHTQEEPEVSRGGKALPVAAEGPGFKSYQGADSAFCSVISRNDVERYWKTKKRGALAMRTLLPENARITKRGGPGFDMWGNPHDPKAGNLPNDEGANIHSDFDLCLWRLEVEPPDKKAYHRFLHVLVPYGDAEGKTADQLSPGAPDFKLIQQPGRDGVRLELNGATWEITFASTGPMAGQVQIRRPGGAPVSAQLATEVKPNPMPPGLAVSGQTAQ